MARFSTGLRLAVVIIVALIALSVAHAEYTYPLTGTLSASDGGLNGTGDYYPDGSSITWWVQPTTWNGQSAWSYAYDLNLHIGSEDDQHPARTLVFEVSDAFTYGDVCAPQSLSFFPSTYDLGPYNSDSDPNLPSTIGNALQITTTWAPEDPYWCYSFKLISPRGPRWADFYVTESSGETDTLFNAGFTESDWDPDSTVSLEADPYSTDVGWHILAPDTNTTVPEPSSILLMALAACSGTATAFRRRRRRK